MSSRRLSRFSLVGALALATLLVACDKQGVHPLGKRKDVIVQCIEQSTWIRSVEGGTEVLIVGVPDFTGLDAQFDALEEGFGVCFNYGRVAYDSTTTLLSGSLARGRGGYDAIIDFEYTFKYEPEKTVLRRSGAGRVEIDTNFGAGFELDGDALILEIESSNPSAVLGASEARRRFLRIGDVIARLDPEQTDIEAPGGPNDVYRMFNLALFVSQPRIPSFGSGGMTTYLEKATFNSLISGTFSVKVESVLTPHASIEYMDFEELEGIFINGLQVTKPNYEGDGTMEGILEIEFYSAPPTDREVDLPHLSATVDYADLIVGNGVAESGFYTLTIEGVPHQIDFSIATDEDLRGILSIEEGLP